jgi:methionyl aminopeptidase
MQLRKNSVELKTQREIEIMRLAGRLAAETLCRVAEIIRPGITTEQIDRFVHEDTLRLGCKPACLHYRGFPKSVCTSVNDVVCHGIPNEDCVLADGDIINVDVTHLYRGYHGDTSATFYVGTPSAEAQHVTEVARRCLEVGVAAVRPGGRLGDIGAAITEFAESQGCSVVRDFVGHGIGRSFHEAPRVDHFGTRGTGLRLRPGMTFTVEPMINLGDWRVEILEDDWTAVTEDGALSAQFEHTVLVTTDGCEVLTPRAGILANSEIFPDHWNNSIP